MTYDSAVNQVSVMLWVTGVLQKKRRITGGNSSLQSLTTPLPDGKESVGTRGRVIQSFYSTYESPS